MKKRIAALFCALLMLTVFAFPTFALIAVEDETGIRYSDESLNPPTTTTTKPNAFVVGARKALEALSDFWRRHGVVTVVVALLAAIVIAIVISEAEQQKKRRKDEPTHKKK